MGTETERKFLVERWPEGADGAAAAVIRQGYLAQGIGKTEVRLRQRDDAFFLTAKRGSGLSRDEYEVAITREQFDTLWPGTSGARLSKTRRVVPLASGDAAELDVYEGPLAGLMTVEVEFEGTAAAAAFSPPDWFGREVTGEDAYANRNLATAAEPPSAAAEAPATATAEEDAETANRRLALATLLVPGYDEGLAFYVGVLKFDLVEDSPLADGKRWVVVRPRGGREGREEGRAGGLLLARAATDGQRARVGDQTGGRVAFFLTTDRFTEDYARMRDAGVRFEEEPRSEAYGRVAVFADPFGNRWDLLEDTGA